MSQDAIADILSELQSSRRRLENLAPISPVALRLTRAMARIAARLSRPPRVVLLGEFNSGKTTLANALIGADVLPTSIHANTRLPLHIRYSAEATVEIELADGQHKPLGERSVIDLIGGRARMLHVGLPAERLKSFELIDTPGLASGDVVLDHINLEACGLANIAIWCTTTTQAWKATEKMTWDGVPSRLHRYGLLVATLADALNNDRDRGRVEARLRQEAAPGFAGLVMVTAAEVDELRRNPHAPYYAERWKASGGEQLDAELGRLIDRVWEERRISTSRVLRRLAAQAGA